jgi:8-oxo-dGTP diphosphatase
MENMEKVTAALLVKGGKILIAKRKSTDKLPNKWEFPGGKIETNETPEECLKREIKEEFGADISVGECLGESICHYDHGSIRLLAYRAFWQGGSFSLADHADFEWVSLHQLKGFDFAPADIPFVEKILAGKIEL